MLKRFVLGLALLVPALWAMPAAAQTAAQYAENMQSVVGTKVGGDIFISAVTAEGNTLVLAIDGPTNWRGSLDPNQISGALVEGFCGSAPEFFKGGVTMRVDSYDNKASYKKGPLITACPAPKQ
jgi:hypothetical protein